MSKSKKNKDRKAKVEKFKQKEKLKKMSMELPKFKPFRQVPHWEPDAEIKITGAEFSTLQSFFNVFAEPINIMQDIFGRNLNDGTITVKYIDNEGKEISKEEVQGYMQEVQNYLASQKVQDEAKEESESISEVMEAEDVPTEILTSEEEQPQEKKLKTNKLRVV